MTLGPIAVFSMTLAECHELAAKSTQPPAARIPVVGASAAASATSGVEPIPATSPAAGRHQLGCRDHKRHLTPRLNYLSARGRKVHQHTLLHHRGDKLPGAIEEMPRAQPA
jgi:hypothetical protein